MQDRRSRSAKKSLKDLDGKTISRKYKTFVRRLGKGQCESDDDQDSRWRGATDFTKITSLNESKDDRVTL